MSCLAGTVIKLSQRVFLNPRVRSNLCCATSRDYSSKIPVKYIPKNTSLNKDSSEARSLPLKRLDRKGNNTRQLLDTEHVVDYTDNRCTGHSGTMFDDYHPCHDFQPSVEAEDEMEDGSLFAKVESDEVIDEIDVDLLCASDGEFVEEIEGIEKKCLMQKVKVRQDVEKVAIELLASRHRDIMYENCRAYTAQELKKKLHRKNLSVEIIDAVIADFQSRGLINDFLYAETFSRSRWSSSSWGPRRIKQALLKKGVSEGDTEKAIKLVFDNGDEDDEDNQPSGIAMSKRSIDQLYIQASKQWQRSCGAPKEKRKSRIVQWLRYRGFNWNVVSYILKKLESECST